MSKLNKIQHQQGFRGNGTENLWELPFLEDDLYVCIKIFHELSALGVDK